MLCKIVVYCLCVVWKSNGMLLGFFCCYFRGCFPSHMYFIAFGRVHCLKFAAACLHCGLNWFCSLESLCFFSRLDSQWLVRCPLFILDCWERLGLSSSLSKTIMNYLHKYLKWPSLALIFPFSVAHWRCRILWSSITYILYLFKVLRLWGSGGVALWSNCFLAPSTLSI